MASINGHLTLSHAAVLLLLLLLLLFLLCATERASCVWTDFPANSLIVEKLVIATATDYNNDDLWYNVAGDVMILQSVLKAEWQPYHLNGIDTMWRIVFKALWFRKRTRVLESIHFEAMVFSTANGVYQFFTYIRPRRDIPIK
ncbi:hypothetical protein AXF42_Ash012520 [Apostasia shenzhenica]|uniref:Uncharacterized protein n=1 Tax=Apostasia shenzhenica TaxID=1088818 RepID=A0A2I0AQZ9_9ASPA|nr:hypothetical protein AXF42_Ash012520 [Apostasia shenzhenica]